MTAREEVLYDRLEQAEAIAAALVAAHSPTNSSPPKPYPVHVLTRLIVTHIQAAREAFHDREVTS